MVLNKYKVYLLPPIPMYKDYWKHIVNNYSAIMLDRTNTFSNEDFGFKYKTLTSIPQFKQFNNSFSDTCELTTDNILNNSPDKNINIFWSGGIDSTAVLVSFLKRPDSFNRLTIILSKDSVAEYPLFFDKYILKNLKHTIVDNPVELINPKCVNITGEIGDQIFGSSAIFNANEKNKLFNKYTDYFSESFIEVMSNQLKKSPIELVSVFDVLWWINFSMKYQYVQLRIYADILKPFGTITHYFDTTDFQLWSLNNHDKKIKDSINSYKYTAKDYIYEFTKDAEYRDNKLKENSLKLNRLIYSIDENFSCIRY